MVNFEGEKHHTATAKSLKEDEDVLKAGLSMPLRDTASKYTESESRFEVIGQEKGLEGEEFIVKHHPTGNISRIVNTFAETFTLMEISPAKSPFFLFTTYIPRSLCT